MLAVWSPLRFFMLLPAEFEAVGLLGWVEYRDFDGFVTYFVTNENFFVGWLKFSFDGDVV